MTFLDDVPEIEEDSRFTKRLISYIERESIRKNFLTVAGETGVSESTVRGLFMKFIRRDGSIPVFETPTVLGIDDVYINRVACCILTDIEKKRVFDILPGRQMETVYDYLIHLKDKENVEIVAMDMSRPFARSVTDALPDADMVIDTFHVQRMGNMSINIFLRDLRKSLNLSQRRICMHDRFILMKRSFNLSPEEKQALLKWRRKLPVLSKVYELKEEFFRIWRISNREDAEIAYSLWQERIPAELRFVFHEILTAVENWEHQIFNYFDYGVTNAFTESANNLVKNIQKQCRGCSFEVVRAKILCRYLLK
jgi:transposase